MRGGNRGCSCQPMRPDPKQLPARFGHQPGGGDPGTSSSACPSSPKVLLAVLGCFLARKSLGMTNLGAVHTHTSISTSLVGKRASRTMEMPGLRYSIGSGNGRGVDPKIVFFNGPHSLSHHRCVWQHHIQHHGPVPGQEPSAAAPDVAGMRWGQLGDTGDLRTGGLPAAKPP